MVETVQLDTKSGYVFLRNVWLLGALSMPGCATWSQHGVTLSSQSPLRIAVAPIAATATVSKLSDIKTTEELPEGADESAAVRQELSQAASQMDRLLANELAAHADIAVLPYAAPDVVSINNLLWEGGDRAVPSLQQFPAAAQAVLLIRLAGYSTLKREWQTYLIGAGVAEGVFQGVLVAQAASTPWAGVAVAAAEIAQEVIVWGGGARLFNSYYAPVTLEAKLISVHNGAVLWSDTVFVSVDKAAIAQLPESERGRKELQLAATAAKALGELIANLRAAIANQARDSGEEAMQWSGAGHVVEAQETALR